MDIAIFTCSEIELFSVNTSHGLNIAHQLERREVMKDFSLNWHLVGALLLNFLMWSGILLLVLQMAE